MKNLILVLAILGGINAGAAEITKNGSESKDLFKGLKSVLGQTCSNGVCKVDAGPMVSCGKIKYVVNVYTCSIPAKELGQVHTLMGGNAKSLYLALQAFQPEICEMSTCVEMVRQINCQAEDKWFANYQCTVDVANPN